MKKIILCLLSRTCETCHHGAGPNCFPFTDFHSLLFWKAQEVNILPCLLLYGITKGYTRDDLWITRSKVMAGASTKVSSALRGVHQIAGSIKARPAVLCWLFKWPIRIYRSHACNRRYWMSRRWSVWGTTDHYGIDPQPARTQERRRRAMRLNE